MQTENGKITKKIPWNWFIWFHGFFGLYFFLNILTVKTWKKVNKHTSSRNHLINSLHMVVGNITFAAHFIRELQNKLDHVLTCKILNKKNSVKLIHFTSFWTSDLYGSHQDDKLPFIFFSDLSFIGDKWKVDFIHFSHISQNFFPFLMIFLSSIICSANSPLE